MTDYILLDGGCEKVMLNSAKSKNGLSSLKFGQGYTLKYDAITEAEWCTCVFNKNSNGYMRAHMIRWLTNSFSGLGPNEIEDFVKKFKEAHPIIEIPLGENKVPLFATETEYCCVDSPLFKENVKITMKDEQELLDMIRWPSRSYATVEHRIRNFFSWHCREYCISTRYKKDEKIGAEDLAFHFCLMHGFNIFDRRYNVRPGDASANTSKVIEHGLCGFVDKVKKGSLFERTGVAMIYIGIRIIAVSLGVLALGGLCQLMKLMN